MSTKYERTFTVAVPVERAWRAFTDPAELAAWFTPRTDAVEARPGTEPVDFTLQGTTFQIEVLEVEPQKLLRYKQGPGVTPGATDVTVAFEAIDRGTRITITQVGFGEGDDWLEAFQGIQMGLAESIFDLILYLEHGLSHPRHHPSRSVLGVGVHDVGAGLRVYYVGPKTFAEAAGLQPGDILLELNGAPVFSRPEIAVITREHRPGEEVEATWARGDQVMRACARLTDRAALAGSERGLRWM